MDAVTSPTGPPGLPLIGNTHQWIRDPCGFKQRIANRYDRVVNFEVIGTDTYLLTNPDDIERVFVETQETFRKHQKSNDRKREWLGDGLVTSEGDLWKSQRDAIQPAFFLERIQSYVDSMVGRATDTANRWEDGQVIDLKSEMMRTALEILVESMFGDDIDLAERGIYQAVENMKGPFEPQNQPITFLAPDWMPVPFLRRSRSARDHLRSQFKDIIRERRTSEETRKDFLSMMLAADTEMSDEQICDEMMTFLMAGHDTTALTLTFIIDLLTRNPQAAETLRAEVDDVVDGRPGFDDLNDLSYTENVVKETMRLYPAAHEMRREPVRDVSFGDYVVPEGKLILLSAWVMHRDERFWDAPSEFRPERWDENPDRPEFAYFPFGGGSRRCIGAQFGSVEAQLVLATLVSQWEFEREYDELDLSTTITLKPKNDIRMTVTRR